MKRIKSLPSGHIFVFGSNLAGIHGKGAALDAARYFGAEAGVGFGLRGQSFAIPTKKHWRSAAMPLEEIKKYIDDFLAIARDLSELTFVVTPVGCGLAGYFPEDIAPMFENHPQNVILPEEFK